MNVARIVARPCVEEPVRLTQARRIVTKFLLAGIVITVPLEFTRQYFPIPAFDLSRLIMVLAMVVLLLEVSLGYTALAVPRRASLVALGVFIAYASISALLIRSGNGEKTALAMIAYAAVMIVVFNWSLDPEVASVAWTALVVALLVLSVTAIVLQATETYIWNPNILGNGYMRVSASYADPNNFARFLSFSTGISILMFADREPSHPRWLYAAASVAAAAANPFTYSRAGWFIFVLCVLLSIVMAKNRRRAVLLSIGTIAVFVIVIAANPGTFARAELIQANLSGPFATGGALASGGRFEWLGHLPLDSVRLYLAAAGLQMFLDHPVFGVGFGGFQHQILTTYSYFIPSGRTTSLPHTSAIAILAEQGVVGAVVVLAMFVLIFKEAWQGAKGTLMTWPVASVVIAVVAILAASQFAARLFDEPYLWVFLGLFYAATSSVSGRHEPGLAAAVTAPRVQR